MEKILNNFSSQLMKTPEEKYAPDSYQIFRQSKNIKFIIGQQLKAARLKKGISQMDLSFELNLDQNYISKIENGKVNISVESLFKICYYLDCYIKLMEKEPEIEKPKIKGRKKKVAVEYVL
jgi:ribosome-binding protein aMBF1 (putative translation factor)